ncbi:MAG: DUF2933 domain-containing protein [Chthoniobacterales bacterium]|nr:DUF2933 domain-containing protein [Chthoniobacterales bacterium]
MKSGLKMVGGCVLAFLAVFLLPALGASNNVTLIIFAVLMIGCHLFMGHGGHGKDDNEPPDKHD